MKLLVYPRDVNRYQELLYSEMRDLGVQVNYLGQGTPSHTLNILLLPLETAVRRLLGFRIVHLHWVASLALPFSGRFKLMRHLSQAWFLLWLKFSRYIGVRFVWTAHNVLPHNQVFADDIFARRELVAACDLVVVHSEPTMVSLGEIGAMPRRSAVIAHGPFAPERDLASLRVPGSGDGPCRFLFIGRVKSYKGVEDLLDAFDALPIGVRAHLTIAGQCDEPALLERLKGRDGRSDMSVMVSNERLSEASITQILESADVVVLPFRRITTSGSAILSLCHGRPLIVPDIPAVSEFPSGAVTRYDGTVSGLASAMAAAAGMTNAQFASMSKAALSFAYRISWREIAEQTAAEMKALLDEAETRVPNGRVTSDAN